MKSPLHLYREAGLISAIDQHIAERLGELASEKRLPVLFACALASHTAQSGHTGLSWDRVDDLLSDPELDTGIREKAADLLRQAITLLDDSPLTGSPEDRTPWVWSQHRLSLRRHFDHEMTLAELLVGRASNPVERDDAREGLDTTPAWLTPLARQRLQLIVGGPGTGKTTGVIHLLHAWIEDALHAGQEAPRIALLAPTGKARSRLEQAVRNALSRLDIPAHVSDHIPQHAETVHRFLGYRQHGPPRTPAAVHQTDAIVLDEASMVDVALMRNLFSSCSPDARIALLGDPNQLHSVNAGSALADMVEAARTKASPLHRCLAELTTSHRYRADSGIGLLAGAIVGGDAESALALLQDVTHSDCSRAEPDFSEAAAWWLDAMAACEKVCSAATPERALELLSAHRILCAHRQGPDGAEALSRRLQEAQRQSPYQPGLIRPIMITRNDYELGLANGDIGVLWRTETGEELAYFPDENEGLRVFEPSRLPTSTDAWALTIHKSQGSEYTRVTIVLPAKASQILTRELLYTAVTRARELVEIVATQETVTESILKGTRRDSGLQAAIASLS